MPNTAVTPSSNPQDVAILLDVRAAARQLSIGRSTLYELLKAGEIASVKIGTLRRIPLTALRDYISRKAAEYQAA